MKFIAASPQTFQTLKKWAGPDTGKLVVAKHFFWITGTDMQKSIEGLYRSLLIQAFEQQPTLIYHVLPENCDTELWTMPMLKKALVALASLDEDLGYKFCFLIDGLDEYDKGANGHELDVVDVIKGLSKSAWIKLCVSSRPWTTFKVAFQDSPQLLVEEFTRADMKKFAWERLIGILPKSADEELDSWRGLAGEIAEKATGVWLWVYLVVKAMRRVVICDEGFDRAKESLDEFPADLGDYFRHIIERTDAQYRREGSRILLVALIAADLRVKFHLDGLCLLLQHPDDFCTPILNKSFQVSRALKSIETIRNRLNNRTRDLLDIEYVTNYDGWRASVETGYAIRTDEQRLNQYTISFLHRTVRDFLKEYYMEPLKRNSGPDFVPAIFLLCNEMVPLSCSNSDVAMTVSLAREHLQDCFSISSIVDRQLRLSLQNTDDHGNLQIRGEVYDDPRRFESSALVRRLKTIQKADGYGAKLIEQYVQLVQSLGDIAFGYGLTPAKIPGGSGCKHKLDKYVRTYLPAADILECPEYFQMLQDPLHAKGMAAIAVTSGLVLFAAAVYRENTPQTTFETLLYWLNAFYCTEKRIRPPCCTDGIMRSYCGQHLTSRHHLLKIRPNGTGEDGTLVEHIEPPAPSRSPVPDFDRLHYIHENAHFQLEMMALLLELGARPNITLQATATTNRSPWMQFLSYGLREETAKMAVLLLRYGADPHCGLFLNLFGKNMAAELVEQARIEGSLRATESDNGFFGEYWWKHCLSSLALC